ncbi:MAG: prepilin-type N-terminal cleavage/methylation domain-containing protein [Planctomycetota bacterium]
MRTQRRGVTLIELLIVIGVLTLMATVALSTVRSLLRDRKVKQAARMVEQYFESAKIRAITTGRPVAVFMDRLDLRLDQTTQTVTPGNYTSTRLSMGEVFPPYTGDVIGAKGTLWDVNVLTVARTGDGFADQVRFAPLDVLSAFGPPPPINSTGPVPAGQGFVSVGDIIEFESVNRSFIIESIDSVQVLDDMGNPIGVEFAVTFFNPPNPSTYNTGIISAGLTIGSPFVPAYSTLSPVLPIADTSLQRTTRLATRSINEIGPEAKFRIYRRPTKSLVGALALPRGTCVDLYASGLGLAGSAQDGAATNPLTYVSPTVRTANRGRVNQSARAGQGGRWR